MVGEQPHPGGTLPEENTMFEVVVNVAEFEAEGEEVVASEFPTRGAAMTFAKAQQAGQTTLNYFVRKMS